MKETNRLFHVISTTFFKEGELDKKKQYAKKCILQIQTNQLRIIVLDVIISVGYRVKSQQGTQFRIWANRVLKEYLIKGYAINEKKTSTKRTRNTDA